MVQTHKFVNDIEANPHPSNVLVIGIARAVKTLKQVWDVLGRNTDTLVGHCNRDQTITLLDSYLYCPTTGTIFHGITDKIL